MSFEPIERLTEEQEEQLLALYRQEWWSADRTMGEVQQALEHSDFTFGICEAESRRLVAFARVLTDHIFKALVFDVIVAADRRDQGLGDALLRQILSHPVVASVRHVELYCLPELVPFYARHGFSTEVSGVLFLRRGRPG